jgi:hypothetical protein
MLAYCGRLLRALRVLAAGPGCGLAAPPVRRTRRTPSSASFCDRFPYIEPRYARETIAETCSMRVALATAIISQTGS